MAAVVPAKLKSADVQRFATRAVQLAKFKPIITYWCEYYILQQILGKQLHAGDEECSNYAIQLMDKLEAYKAENTTNDAIIDDVTAKIYVENFALETFNRADESQRLNKVTRQTADTFSAASVFLDLLSIWGQLEPEVASKSRFAKFHALRISKAIKAGEDPNASNPVIETPAPIINPTEDISEAEVRNLETPNDGGVYRQPTVESLPGSALPSRPSSTFQNGNLSSPPLPSQVSDHNVTTHVPSSANPQVSPVETAENTNSRAGSVGGGYFPSVPEASSTQDFSASFDQPPQSGFGQATPSDPASFYHTAPPLNVNSPNESKVVPLNRPYQPSPHQMTAQPPVVPVPVQAPPPVQRLPPNIHSGPPPGGYKTDDESVLAAQKHARWAISALNFEDVNTAVKELRIALESLGAS